MALYKQNGSDFWWYDFTVDGKRYRGSTKEARKTTALTIEAELRLRAREKGPNFIPQRRAITLRELAPRFLGWKGDAQLEPKTQIYYEYGWKLLAATPLASMQLAHITADAVDATVFRKAARDQHGEGQLVSPKYANQAICTLKRMLSKAREWHLLSEVPVIKPRKAYGRTGLFTAEDETKLLEHASQPLRDILMIAMDTGMRPSEIFRMRWEDVHWEALEIFIPKSKTDAGRRRVPMSKRMQAVLLGRWTGDRCGWCFPTRSAEGHIKSVKTAFNRARKKAGLDPRLVLYSARHTFGTYSLAATKNLPAVMQTMGHANVRSTLPYQHHGFESIRAVIESRNLKATS
ncbi:site-specific recombinase XerD [Terriglobus roseus DSM 18391]|uniref:Site-specific recombinase XerD n=1 Tax=Terriglobus roseus (strain DSM 18391 / NRRL B-41598 / KBS 63) TaxID=926566 RepID=I3ZJK6_TERRK|nr:site-specific integrase [Terriglobus roseus]AFL89424.1 site-specific recombinase XerD [Terriglobus roseus DSM 18391]